MSAIAQGSKAGAKSPIVEQSMFSYDKLLVRPPRVSNGKTGKKTYVSFAMKDTNLPLYMKFVGWCGLGFTDPYVKTAPGVAPSKKQIDEAVSKASTYSYEIAVPEELLSHFQAWDKYMPEYVFENRAILLEASSILDEDDESIMKKMIARAYKPILKYSKKDNEKKYPKIAVCFRRQNFERQAGKLAYTQEEAQRQMVLELYENGKPKQIKTYDEMKNFIRQKSKVSQLISFDFWRLNDQFGIKVMTNNINTMAKQSNYNIPSGNCWDADGSLSETKNEDTNPYASNPYASNEEEVEAEEASASVEDSEENLEAEIEAEASADEEDASEELADEPEEEDEPEPEPEPVKTAVKKTVTRKAPVAKKPATKAK